MTDRSQLRKVLAATVLGSTLVFLDGTIVNVLLPALRRDFSLTLSHAQWIIQAYLLVLSSLLLLGGSLGDHLGRKRIFQFGIIVFTLSSLACALSPNFNTLLAARAVQGLGGALLTPGSLAIINAVFPKNERGKAIGAWASFTTLAVAAGPILGGYLVDHFSWRWAFALNLPFAILSWYLTQTSAPETCSEQHEAPLDFSGATLAILSLCGITYGLLQRLPFVSIGAFALFAAFLFYEKRTQSPMLPLNLFRNRLFSTVNALTFFVYGALGIVTFILPFQLIEVRGLPAWQAGATNFPFIAAVFLLSRFTGALLDKSGPRLPLTSGPIVTGSGILLLRWMTTQSEAPYEKAYLFPMLVIGIGMAITITPLTTTVMTSLDETYAGTASGINNTVARLSSLLAIAMLPIVLLALFRTPFHVSQETYQGSLEIAAALAFIGAIFGSLATEKRMHS